jgi:hypothetical protein
MHAPTSCGNWNWDDESEQLAGSVPHAGEISPGRVTSRNAGTGRTGTAGSALCKFWDMSGVAFAKFGLLQGRCSGATFKCRAGAASVSRPAHASVGSQKDVVAVWSRSPTRDGQAELPRHFMKVNALASMEPRTKNRDGRRSQIALRGAPDDETRSRIQGTQGQG